MKTARSIGIRLGSLWRSRFNRDLSDEYAFHLEMSVRDYVAGGMDPQEARFRAMKDFGNRAVLQERSREMLTFARLEGWYQDIRHAIQALMRNPEFALAAILTLALAVGANVAVFSVVYGVLLRPLPYRDGAQLVVLHQEAPNAGLGDVAFSVQEILDYRGRTQTLDAVVEHHSMNFLLFGVGRAERVDTAVVSANFFDVLGVEPLLGRTFVASDDAPDAEAVIVLSHEYWQARHGGDPAVLGQVFEMNDRPHRVIGVLPPIPQYPIQNEVYMPTSHCPMRSSAEVIGDRQHRMMTAFGRLKPGVSVGEAQADLSAVAAGLVQSYPEAYPAARGYGMRVTGLRDDLTEGADTALLVLLGTTGFVLLIACANVANLFLARLLKIRRELSLRMALGATRGRLARQLLSESMLVSLLAGFVGIPLAFVLLRLLIDFAGRFTTRAAEVQTDAPVLIFTVLLSAGVGLLFGLGPAVTSGRKLGEALQDAGSRTTPSRNAQRLRAGLVVAQVAVSFVLLVGAGLMVRSFLKLQQVDPGFRVDRVLTMRLSPNYTRISQPEQLRQLTGRILRSVGGIAGVESAALGNSFPFRPGAIANGPDRFEIEIEGLPRAGPQSIVDADTVSPDYFRTIGQRTLEGRTFTGRDDTDSPMVAVINESMARSRWGSASPIGRRFLAPQFGISAEIVGVVSDVREYGLDRPVGDKVYLALAQNSGFAGNLVVRTSVPPASVLESVRTALLGVDSELALDRVATMEELREQSVVSPRLMTSLLGLFALLALLISASGIAAVMALLVSQRTKELGIRMTLGASRHSVLSMVIGHGFRLALLGTLFGIGGAALLSRLLSSLLYETRPTDPVTFLAVAVTFLTVAVLACLVPARRVTAIDPLIALRQD